MTEPRTVSGDALRLALTRWGDPSAWNVESIVRLVVQAEAEAAASERERYEPFIAILRKQHSGKRCGNGCSIARMLVDAGLADPEPTT